MTTKRTMKTKTVDDDEDEEYKDDDKEEIDGKEE